MDNVEVDRFSMNGKALCLLGRDAFLLRAPFAGDVLFEYLQRMLSTGWYDQILRSFHGNGTKRKDTIKGALEVIVLTPNVSKVQKFTKVLSWEFLKLLF